MTCGVFALLFTSLPCFLPFVFFSCPLVLSFSPFVLLLSCFPAWLLLLVFGSACVVVVGFLSLSDGFRYEKGAHFLRPFLRCVVSWLLESVTGGQLI